VAIVGAGQAGLSMSAALSERGLEHRVLDCSAIGNAWRQLRWDSFRLVTPNWHLQLPGFGYDGDEPEGFMRGEEVAAFLERYAAHIDPPLESPARVRSVRPMADRWSLQLANGELEADAVVIATGTHHRPRIPAFAEHLPQGITQIDPMRYRNPGALPDGAVLVVGSGQSGSQIADELRAAGRRVLLSVGDAGKLPRRYRGRDIMQWLHDMGLLRLTVDDHPDGMEMRHRAQPQLSAYRDIDLRQFALEGIELLGRVRGGHGRTLELGDTLEDDLDAAETYEEQMLALVDDFIRLYGIDAPEDDRPEPPLWDPSATPQQLDLEAEGIGTLVWATGYEPDFRWIDAPVFDDSGRPVQTRGVTERPGLCFLGLHWMYSWGSGLFYGVGQDARFLAAHLERMLRG
jgi:putative flavoprotein involved in K+ transport